MLRALADAHFASLAMIIIIMITRLLLASSDKTCYRIDNYCNFNINLFGIVLSSVPTVVVRVCLNPPLCTVTSILSFAYTIID